MSALLELEQYVAGLSGAQLAELDKMLAPELNALWLPEPENEPQCAAYYSFADLMLFGGSPGGGKSDLLVGLALTQHHRSVIFRSQSVDLRGLEERIITIAGRDGWNGADKILRKDGKILELGHLARPGAELSWQGRAHDFIGFDEGAQLARSKVSFVMGWLRSVKAGQRRRMVIASNPPTGGEGEWLVEWFAPWLDPRFLNPAKSGELRMAVTAPDRDATTIWVNSRDHVFFETDRNYRKATQEEIDRENPRVCEPMTRTFIPSMLRDNPYLAKTGYRAQLQALPEPLRSQLLNGDFMAGRADHEWQVIPTRWVQEAQARWKPQPPLDAAMTAIGVDVAQGGADDSTLAPRHGPWYAELISRPGVETPRPSDVAGMVVAARRNGAVVIVDMGGGYGGGVKERLEENNIEVAAYNGANESGARTADKQLAFVNKRAEVHWRFREALDPDQDGGSKIALPPHPRILADLTAPRWKLMGGGIQVESKLELKKPERLGRSPDWGDAIIQAWSEGEKAIVRKMKKAARSVPLPKLPSASGPLERGTGWMGRS
jgi:hypothetical protein